MFVGSIDLQRAMDIYEIRGALAGLAGKLIVQRATDDDIAALRLMVERMDVTVESGVVAEYYRQNIAFHSALVRCTGNQRLVDIFLGTDKERSEESRVGKGCVSKCRSRWAPSN